MMMERGSGFLSVALGALALCGVPGAAWATDINVTCPADSINTALGLLDVVGPHTISVTGTCHEAVVIFNRDRVTITGDAVIESESVDLPAINVAGSHNIALSGLTLTGGSAGLRVARGSEAVASDLTSTNNVFQGIVVTDHSYLRLSVATVTGNGAAGIRVDSSTANLTGALTIENNGANGIVGAAARINLSDGDGLNSIRNNGGGGVALSDSSRGNLVGLTTIQGNTGGGVLVFHTSTVNLIGAVVDGNGGTGVSVQETSHGELISLTVSNNGGGGIRVADNSDLYIDGGVSSTGNTGVGVLVELGGDLSSLGGNTISGNSEDGVLVRRMGLAHYFAPDIVTGNGGHALECDNTSLVVGDLTGISKVKCSRIDAETSTVTPTSGVNHAHGN